MTGRPILTAEAMRAAEQGAMDRGTSVETLMERAGKLLAEAAWRFAGPLDTLVLAGPGNNGGDGYVAARHLAARGLAVRVAALAEPATPVARWARSQWHGPVEPLADARPAPLLVDCLFGTGLKRPLDGAAAQRLGSLAGQAQVAVACDLPSGVETDSGAVLSPIPNFGLTVTFGALKPAHLLSPAMHAMGRLVLADIGIAARSDWFEIGAPEPPRLDPAGHKYGRGLVAVLAGTMPGAAALAAAAAARAGAGYVRLHSRTPIANVPAAVVQGQAGALDDPRIGALLVGPGLGHDRSLLDSALDAGRPLVLDADALNLLGSPDRLHGRTAILTPHAGEFRQLFGGLPGAKPGQALAAARASQAVVVFKGPDTLVAAPDGQLGFAPPAPAWLATAGTGDVLAGMVAARLAGGAEPFDAACDAVWLHGRAAERAGPAMIADDLVAAL